MTKTIRFNTGRQYTTHGQRITATLHDDGIVTFYDHDRMIDGQYETLFPDDFNERQVMTVYDAGTYTTSARSWADGMQVGGCNTIKW